MKKFLRYIIISIFIVVIAFSVTKISNKYSLTIMRNDIDCEVISKGCECAKSIAKGQGYIYVAYDHEIKEINSEGKERTVYRDKTLEIEDMVYFNNNLIYVSNDSIERFSLNDNKVDKLYLGLPLGGNGIDRKLLVKGNDLFIAIGAVTNSGIAEYNEYDLSPIYVELNGVNYNRTGAFKKYLEESYDGEKIKKSTVGNAAVYKLDLKKGGISLFASGIRGIAGFDVNSDGEIISIFSGMKNEGVRPINRDKDYIYKIDENKWYGWPDFSGADPVDSPRFKGTEVIKPLLKNPPTKIIDAPLYQHNEVDSLRELAIDKDGRVFDKDSFLCWDKKEKSICNLNKNGSISKVIELKENSIIEDIKYNEGEFLILDSGIGCIYSLHEKEGLLGFKIPTIIWIFIFLLSVSILLIIILKLAKTKENKNL